MTAFVATSVSIALDTTAAGGLRQQTDLNATAEAKPWDNFGGGGWRSFATGLMMVTLDATGFNDFASTGLDAAVPLTGFGGSSVYCVSVPALPPPTRRSSGRVRSSQLPAGFKIGEVSDWSLGLSGNGRMVRGSLLPSAAAPRRHRDRGRVHRTDRHAVVVRDHSMCCPSPGAGTLTLRSRPTTTPVSPPHGPDHVHRVCCGRLAANLPRRARRRDMDTGHLDRCRVHLLSLHYRRWRHHHLSKGTTNGCRSRSKHQIQVATGWTGTARRARHANRVGRPLDPVSTCRACSQRSPSTWPVSRSVDELHVGRLEGHARRVEGSHP